MRISMGAVHLAAFVPGQFALPQTPVLTTGRRINSAGMAEFVPGQFAVPQTPVITRAVARRSGTGMGDFVPGKFAVPQNPVSDAQRGMGCGCGGGCSKGMGQTDFGTEVENVWTSLQTQSIGPFQAGYVVAGLLVAAPVLAMWMSGRKR